MEIFCNGLGLAVSWVVEDHVSTILEQWRRVRPELDVGPMGTVGRLSRLARNVEYKLDQNFARFGLDTVAFDLLAALRRQGDPYSLSPKTLQFEMMISSGSTTYRIDRLEQRGLVARQPNPGDRRGTHVRLTSEGLALIDDVVVSHVQLEASYLSVLSPAQGRKLEELLTLLTQAQGL